MNNKQIKEFLDKKSNLDLSSKSRKVIYIKYRCIYYYLAFKYSDQIVTNENVAKEVNRNHATVLSGFKVYKNLYKTDKAFRCLSDSLEDEITQMITYSTRRDFKSVDNSKDFVLRRKVKNLILKNRNLYEKVKYLTRQYSA